MRALEALRRRGFLIGSLAVTAGVAMHFPDFIATRNQHFMMAGMAMSPVMLTGMGLIVAGLAVGLWSLLPPGHERLARARRITPGGFAALDQAELGRAHKVLAMALTVALVVDTMKPASLGFVTPGLAAEYGISTRAAASLSFVAITGTVLGSVLWGYAGDILGRRSAIMFSGLLYVGTSICGFMPSLQWNWVMCGLMGMSAGGMLPIVFSLMSESVPARQRGWLLVLQSGLGTTLGYVVASGAASVLIPHFGWRVIWLLGAPTGLLLIGLNRHIPESPRFLLACGRDEEAARVMSRYGVQAVPTESRAQHAPQREAGRAAALLSARYRPRTLGILLYGLGWGMVNWGFVTFLPVFLRAAGAGAGASRLLFASSLLAVPATAVAALLYARWSSRRSMLAYAAGTVVVLLLFALLSPQRHGGGGLLVVLVTVLLAGIGGMAAMLSPYAAEVYPTELRATGSGLAAASTKAGGMLGPLLLTSAPRLELLAVAVAAPVAAATAVLWRTGVETAGRPLVEATPTTTMTPPETTP
jgi:putative MFS transporter